MKDERLEWYYSNEKYFTEDTKPLILNALETMSDAQFLSLLNVKFKNPSVALILSITLGDLGIDRFYLGEAGMGVLKLLTFGGFGILWLIDIFKATKKARRYNLTLLMNAGVLSAVEASQAYNRSNAESEQKIGNYINTVQQTVNSKEFQNLKQGLKGLNDNSYVSR